MSIFTYTCFKYFVYQNLDSRNSAEYGTACGNTRLKDFIVVIVNLLGSPSHDCLNRLNFSLFLIANNSLFTLPNYHCSYNFNLKINQVSLKVFIMIGKLNVFYKSRNHVNLLLFVLDILHN